jgi:hypothetical protein
MAATCEYAFVTARRCSPLSAGVDGNVTAKLLVLPYEILWFWLNPLTLTTWMFHVHHDLLCLENVTRMLDRVDEALVRLEFAHTSSAVPAICVSSRFGNRGRLKTGL